MTAASPLYLWGGLNREIFLWINQSGGPWKDQIALAGTWVGDHRWYPIAIALAFSLALLRPQWLAPHRVLVLSWAYLLNWAAIAVLKPLLNFPRPLAALGPHWVHVLGRPEFQHSFPSGHAAWVFLLLGSLSPGAIWPLRLLLLLLALWVAWARVAVGAHFPADVLGGALIGLACAALASLLLRPWRPGIETRWMHPVGRHLQP